MPSKGNGDRRVAVVTGGAGAIGGAIVDRLALDHTVVVLDRAGDVVVDLGDPDDVRRRRSSSSIATADATSWRTPRRRSRPGQLTRSNSAPGARFRWSTWSRRCCSHRRSFPECATGGFGRVIFIVSNTFWSPPDGQMLSYVASKGTLIGMTRTLAVGLGRVGIAVR